MFVLLSFAKSPIDLHTTRNWYKRFIREQTNTSNEAVNLSFMNLNISVGAGFSKSIFKKRIYTDSYDLRWHMSTFIVFLYILNYSLNVA